MKVLITGGAGFIGSHVVADILDKTDWRITLIDRLDDSGNLNRLSQVGAAKNPRVKFVFHDLRAPINDQVALQLGDHDYILHLAALTHVDRAIEAPLQAVADNVLGTAHILEHARRGCERFVYFSTDEVFGPAPAGVKYREWDRYRSTNPYSATKAGGEELALAWHNTYGVPALITHTMNAIGPMQHWEKYVPNTIRKILSGEEVTIHADAACVKPGSRHYIHASNIADALRFLLSNGEIGEKYNIVGEQELDNLQVAKFIEKFMDCRLKFRLVSWHASRPGHDLRYALCGEKLAKMGWTPPLNIETALEQTTEWYLGNRQWLGLRPGFASIVESHSSRQRGAKNTVAASA